MGAGGQSGDAHLKLVRVSHVHEEETGDLSVSCAERSSKTNNGATEAETSDSQREGRDLAPCELASETREKLVKASHDLLELSTARSVKEEEMTMSPQSVSTFLLESKVQ